MSAAEAALLAGQQCNQNPQSRFTAMMESYTSSPPLNLRLDSSEQQQQHARVAIHRNLPMNQSRVVNSDNGANNDDDDDDVDDGSVDDESDDSDRPDTPINIV